MNRHGVACGLAFMAALGNTSAFALVGGSVDANLASSPWAGVGAITINGSVYSGVLIDSTHVLTAAHVVAGQVNTAGNVSFSLNAGGDLTHTLSASAITLYPGYTGTTPGADGVWHDDLAIITLSEAVTGSVPMYDLYGGSLKKGTTITLVGYGAGGDGVHGATSGANASVKRVGQNKADLLLRDDDGGAFNEVFMFDFDGPTKSTNYFGAGSKSNLTLGATVEAQYAGGDSGSPMFVKDKGVWKLAGIGTFNAATSLSYGSNTLFGSLGGGTLVAPYIPWIESTLVSSIAAAPVPEPHAWLTMIAGLGLVGAAGYRRRRA